MVSKITKVTEFMIDHPIPRDIEGGATYFDQKVDIVCVTMNI